MSKKNKTMSKEEEICTIFNIEEKELNRVLKIEVKVALSSNVILDDLAEAIKCTRINSATLCEFVAFLCLAGNLGINSKARISLLAGTLVFCDNGSVPLREAILKSENMLAFVQTSLPRAISSNIEEYDEILAQIQAIKMA